MNEISLHIGSRIRSFRKKRKLTLQQLADRIHKSRASVSKYETGEITLDVETLYEISTVLNVELSELTDYCPVRQQPPALVAQPSIHNPFFQASLLYFYFYDGRYHQMKDGIIHIYKTDDPFGARNASLTIRFDSPSGRSSEIRYTGKVVYSDMLIRFSFVNQYNALEEDLLYIFNPLEVRDFTEGLLCGISSTDLMPCAFKCLVTLNPREHNDDLRQHLMLTSEEVKKWQKANMFMVGNKA